MAKMTTIKPKMIIPSGEELQMYFDFGMGFSSRKSKSKRNSIKFEGTGVGFSKNILNREEAKKSTKGIKKLGGMSQKKDPKDPLIQLAIPLDEVTLKKFSNDCKLRKQTSNFRLASIVINRYSKYFAANEGCASSIVNITATGQHAHTDFLKRSGFSGINKLEGKRKIKMFALRGVYQTILYPALVQLCIDNNMSMGCFIGTLLEAEYKNYKIRRKLNKVVVAVESSAAEAVLDKSGYTDRCSEAAIKAGTMIDVNRKQSAQFYAMIKRNVKRITNRLHNIASASLDGNSFNKDCRMSKSTQLMILDTQVVNK